MCAVPPPPLYNPPADLPLNIAFEDAALVVANKPAGLLSVPGRGQALQDCLEGRLREEFGPLTAVHRLDMDTSGLIVFARTDAALKGLSKQFRDRTVHKAYTALVAGNVSGDAGAFDMPIGRDWDARPLRRIDHESGKPALTEWRVTARHSHATELELIPLTGRTHQLRLHCAASGHPILGDRLYGGTETSPRLCLHAHLIRFRHPDDGSPIEAHAPATFV